MLEALGKKLRKHEFDVHIVANAQEAAALVLGMIPADVAVGVGGSVTIRQMGLVEALRARGNTVADHWQEGLDAAQRNAAAAQHPVSPVFLTSTNAITEQGWLVNVDNTGNRVAAMLFGPEHVIVVAGRNKITPDYAAARDRLSNHAAPMNARRRQDKTPCAADGTCHDCDSPYRTCRAITILERKTKGVERFSIILVDEDLGY